jgi:hypothetical protein
MTGRSADGTADASQGYGRRVTYEQPLRPDEDEYRTPQASPDVAPSGDPLEPEASTPVAGSSPWLIIGVVLLVVFVGALVWAVVLPLLS